MGQVVGHTLSALQGLTPPPAPRPAERSLFYAAGQFPRSAGGSCYCLLVIDDATDVGWTLFMPDKSRSTVCNALRNWHTGNQEIVQQHGAWQIGYFDNETEFANTEVMQLLVDVST